MKKQIINFIPLVAIFFTLMISCSKSDTSLTPHDAAQTSLKLIDNSRDIPIEAIFYNDCCGEDVSVGGTAHMVITDSIIHTVVKDISGTGLTTGYSYTSRGASVETNVFYANHYEGTLTFLLNMRNDNGCSFKMNVLLHITVNAAGDVTAIAENITTQCE